MNLSMYDASVPVFRRMLTNLSALLSRATAHAEARRIDPVVLLQQRLHPDMYALPKQVQIACDAAKFAVARLSGRQAPSHPDTETSFADLQARIAATIAYLDTATPAMLEASAGREVEVKVRDATVKLGGSEYLTRFALPNFYFHVTTAYAILRHNGVEVGKKDYLGSF